MKYLCSLTISILDASKCSNGCCGFPRQDDLSPPLQGGFGQCGDSMGGSFTAGTEQERGCELNKGTALQLEKPPFLGLSTTPCCAPTSKHTIPLLLDRARVIFK